MSLYFILSAIDSRHNVSQASVTLSSLCRLEIHLTALLWIFSRSFLFLTSWGDHTVEEYSSTGLISDLYMVKRVLELVPLSCRLNILKVPFALLLV